MLNAEAYAEVIDRHVELAGNLAWLESLLDQSDAAMHGRAASRDHRASDRKPHIDSRAPIARAMRTSPQNCRPFVESTEPS